MNRKTLIGGLIALGIIGGLILFCGWIGEKFWQSVTNETETTETQTPPGRKPNAPITNAESAQRIYLALGNPSGATQNVSNADNFLIINTAYTLSYNSSKGTPNWVSWRIAESDLGDVDRQNDFRPDVSLPKNFTRVTPSDYTGSGFDRGHLCPSADRSSSPEANSLTFLMTNMVPQTADLNQKVWKRFEDYSRELVRRGKVDLYVIAGVYGEKGKLKKKVTVPANCWKVIVALPQGADVSDVNADTHVIAVDMPNVAGIGSTDWRQFRTTVRAIEQRANINLLSNVPQNLQDALENTIENK